MVFSLGLLFESYHWEAILIELRYMRNQVPFIFYNTANDILHLKCYVFHRTDTAGNSEF